MRKQKFEHNFEIIMLLFDNIIKEIILYGAEHEAGKGVNLRFQNINRLLRIHRFKYF